MAKILRTSLAEKFPKALAEEIDKVPWGWGAAWLGGAQPRVHAKGQYSSGEDQVLLTSKHLEVNVFLELPRKCQQQALCCCPLRDSPTRQHRGETAFPAEPPPPEAPARVFPDTQPGLCPRLWGTCSTTAS